MDNTEESIVELVDVSVIYQQDKAACDIQVSTAHAYPRNIKRAVENAIAIVTMDMEIAKSCTYSVPRAGKAITGPSTHLANILSQCWGNMRVESKVVLIEQKQVTSEGVCWDLESNLAKKTQVKRSIVSSSGRRYSEDMITVTGNAGNSIASRNAIFSVIPRGIVDKVYNAAKDKITGDISDATKLIARRKQVFDGLIQTYGVTEKEILSAVGKAAIDHIGADELVVLIGIGTAIKDGDTTVEQAFKGQKANDVPDAKVTKEEKLKDRVTKLIEAARNVDELKSLEKDVPAELKSLYDAQLAHLQKGGKLL